MTHQNGEQIERGGKEPLLKVLTLVAFGCVSALCSDVTKNSDKSVTTF